MDKKQFYRPVAMGAIFIASIFTVICFVEEVSADEPIVVNSAGGGDWPTITQAVNAAGKGATIQIQIGNGYNENVVINKELTIIGTGITRPIVHPASQGSISPIFDIQERNVTISYLEFDGTNTNAKAGIRSYALATEVDNVHINDCVIHGFQYNGFGIFLTRYGSVPYPTGHLIDENNIYNNNVGIYIESDPSDPPGSFNHIVEKNTISNQVVNNYNEYGIGIFNHGDKNIIQDNRIYSNQESGIELSDSYLCDISDSYEVGYPSQIYDNEIGIYINNSNYNDIGGSINRMILIYNNNYGVRVVNSANNEIFYTNFSENDHSGVNTYNGDYTEIHNCDFIEDSQTEMIPCNHIELQVTDHCTIENNRIIRDSDDHTRIELKNSDINTIQYNIFDGVIHLSQGSDSNIIQYMENFRSIEILSGDSNFINECDISYPDGYADLDACIILESSDDTHVYDCNLAHAEYGLYIANSDGTVINGLSDPEKDMCSFGSITIHWIYMVTSTTYNCTTKFKNYQCSLIDYNDEVALHKIGENNFGSILRWYTITPSGFESLKDADCYCIQDPSI